MTQGKVAANGLPPSSQQHNQAPYSHNIPGGTVPTSNSAPKKKKKKSGKGKKADEGADAAALSSSPTFNEQALPVHLPPTPSQQNVFAPTAHDLLETASDLYRRIEADPQGIPDDEAYWSSLPSHLRTFIRNALPLGQFPTNAADPSARQASTQAMIAVAQQLASAAHASQRHLEQYPPGSQPFSSIPFDPSIFADLALTAESAGLPLMPHPNLIPNGSPGSKKNPNAPVFRVNERGELVATGEIQADLDEDFYSDEEEEEHDHAHDHGQDHDHDRAHLSDTNGKLPARDGVWIQQDVSRVNAPNGVADSVADDLAPGTGAKKNKKKKKKKSGVNSMDANPPPPPQQQPLVAATPAPPRSAAVARPNPPPSSQPAPAPPRAAAHTNPPPSSRAAGKQPMQSAATGPTSRPPQPRSGNAPPSSTSAGKRPASNSSPAASAPAAHNGHATPAAPPATAGRIWSASSAEERERIKEFWLSLPENDRRSLVKVEKDAVLRKMKEQQKHACACAVCGRKRNAIEDELEVLYDAYYDELENYANHQMQYVSSGGAIPPPPGPGPFPGSVALDNNGHVIGGESFAKDGTGARGPPPRSALAPPSTKAPPPPPPHNEHLYDDEELEDDDYDDEDDYEDEEEDDLDGSQDGDYDANYKRPPATVPGRRTSVAPTQPPVAPPAAPAATNGDLFNFGSSLTVKGGILTVADDLLKNDGQKFLEMMEQLAERRMVREEDALNAIEGSEDEEDEEDDYIDEDEEDEEEDDEDEPEDEHDELITEEQRMEEGRRMFQIFAARMFEQRVLQAYREKVAQERQLQLLRELEEEDLAEKEREAKRAKENQKKKDKKKQQKQQKEEERLKRESEKAAEEAAAKAKIEKQREADLKRQDELRAKREAEKRAKDEEKARKEEEKRKRLDEERARELEKDRKNKEKLDKVRLEKEAHEARAREKKAKEEEQRKEREVKEREEKERKLRAEQERRVAEAARKEKDAAEKAAAAARAERQLQAQNQRVAAAAAAARAVVTPTPSSPARSFASKAPAPVTAASSAPVVPPVAPRSRNPSMSTSPSAPAAATARGAAAAVRPAFGTATQRPSQVPSPSLVASSFPPQGPSSSLPAPPQGLPARPSAHAPSASSSNANLAPPGLPASLPRPPNAGQSAGFMNPQASAAPLQPQPPSVPQQQQPPHLQQHQQQSHPVSGQSAMSAPGQVKATSPVAAPEAILPQTTARNYPPGFGVAGLPSQMPMHGSSTFDALRSPSVPNPGGNLGLGNVDSIRSPIEGLSSSGIGNATTSLASLNLGTQPMGPPLVGPGYRQSGQMTNGMPVNQQVPHTRSHSISDSAASGQQPGGQQLPFRSGSSLSHRAIQRPAPGPIGPIGRPRPSGDPEDSFGMAGFASPATGSSASSVVGGNSTGLWNQSTKLPEGILGSSALGGDDEVVDPHPRRTSSTIPPISSGSGLGPASGSGFSSPFGFSSASSPWSAFPAHGSSHLGNSNVGGMGIGSPGLASGDALGGQGAFANNDTAGMDLWSLPSNGGLNGWDRARSAFEQPASMASPSPSLGQPPPASSLYSGHVGQGSQHQALGPHGAHALQHPLSGAGGIPQSPAGLASPFGSAPRNIFAPPANPSLINPVARQPVSPQRGHGDRNRGL